MPSATSVKLGLKYRWSLGENNWNTDMDANLRKIDGVLQLAVVSRSITTPPSGVEGDLHIIPAGATGIWTGKTNQVAHYLSGAYVYYTPKEGWQSWVMDEDIRIDFDGSSWALHIPVISCITANRPTGTPIGTPIYDTTLNKPVWHKGSNIWVDALGNVV